MTGDAARQARERAQELTEPLCDDVFRGRLLRQALSNDEIAEYVHLVATERAAAATTLRSLADEVETLTAECGELAAQMQKEYAIEADLEAQVETLTWERDEAREALSLILTRVEDANQEFVRLDIGAIARAALAAVEAGTETPTGPPPGYVIPSGDERCSFTMDACTCMKRKGHDGLHACAHGGWRGSESTACPGDA